MFYSDIESWIPAMSNTLEMGKCAWDGGNVEERYPGMVAVVTRDTLECCGPANIFSVLRYSSIHTSSRTMAFTC